MAGTIKKNFRRLLNALLELLLNLPLEKILAEKGQKKKITELIKKLRQE